jgi:uncharacterized protein YecT (DUF1311 family)
MLWQSPSHERNDAALPAEPIGRLDANMIAILLILQAAAASASACSDPKGQSEENRCAFEKYHQADLALNEQWKRTVAYQRMLDAANDTDKDGMPTWADALTHAQRAWVAFRDAQCECEGLEMRGSARAQLQGECLARLTRERTAYLKDLVGSESEGV